MPCWDDNDTLTEDPQSEISLIWYGNRGGLEDRVFRIKTERSSATLLATLQQRVTQLSEQQQATEQRLKDLLGEYASAELWQQQLDQQLEHAVTAHRQASDTLQTTANQLIQLQAELKAEQERLHALQHEHDAVSTQVAQWRAQHTALDDLRLQQLLSYDEAGVRELRQRLKDSESAVQQARVLLHEREQRLAAHQAQANGNLDAVSLDLALSELHAQLAASEQLSADLRAQQSEDVRRQNANQALAQRIAHAYDEWQRWARLNALIGSATGDTFRKIAQAYNLDLLVHHANVQLRQLVRRYRLKRGSGTLGLLVLDTEMGDELRSVHSLSGGETFLVSLALALGLASMASSTLKIESLFIDEGFGSLDAAHGSVRVCVRAFPAHGKSRPLFGLGLASRPARPSPVAATRDQGCRNLRR